MKFDTTTLKRLMSPAAYQNLDVFVEQLPIRAGYAAIIAGALCLLLACGSIAYVVLQANSIMALRADILKAESLKPTVPVIAKANVEDMEVQSFVKKIKDLYPQLDITFQGGRIELRSQSTEKYGAFREVVGHMFNGGKGWRVATAEMCVGRECKNSMGIYGAFTIYRLRVDKPAT